MKSLVVALFLVCGSREAFCQMNRLIVVVKDIRNDRGQVGAALYRSASEFMNTVWKAKSDRSIAGDMQFIFDDLPAGTYAISVLHDLNSNSKMDTNALGIPKEGYGFSNDVIGTFGPPRFDKASFVVPETKQVTITMKYF